MTANNIPAGFVLAPRELTGDNLFSAWRAAGGVLSHDKLRYVYSEMIASPVAHETPNASDNGACVQPASGEVADLDLDIAAQGVEMLLDALLPGFECVGVSLRVSAEDHAAIRSAMAGARTSLRLIRNAIQSLAAAPVSPQAPAPQAAARNAMQFIYDDHVRPEHSGDAEGFDGLSWYDFGSSRQHPCVINARGRTVLKDGDWIVKIGTQYHAFTPEVYALLFPAPSASPHQGADALREASQDFVIEQLIESSDGRWHDGEFRIDGQDLTKLLRAALARHQAPQQGEQHE